MKLRTLVVVVGTSTVGLCGVAVASWGASAPDIPKTPPSPIPISANGQVGNPPPPTTTPPTTTPPTPSADTVVAQVAETSGAVAPDKPTSGPFVDIDGDGTIGNVAAEALPDYLPAVTDDGKLGYVRVADLMGDEPATPDEALASMSKPRALTIYAADGVTIIGVLTSARGTQSAGSDE